MSVALQRKKPKERTTFSCSIRYANFFEVQFHINVDKNLFYVSHTHTHTHDISVSRDMRSQTFTFNKIYILLHISSVLEQFV